MTGITPISPNYLYPTKPSIGAVAPSGKRLVTPVPKDLLGLVDKPKGETVVIRSTGADPERDTVPLMKDKIRNKAYQVKRLAKKLKGPSVFKTVENDWNFIFRHIQYIEDPKTVEAVRDPSRTIYDAKGDCDCFTVLLGALLFNQNIPFKIRVAAYEQKGEWNHVYIVVPDGEKLIVADPVMHEFNAETPFVDHKDFSMKLVSLEGPKTSRGLGQCEMDTNQSANLKRYIDEREVVMWGYIPTQEFLEENNIPYIQQADNASTMFVITTPVGEIEIPTIITHQQAQEIKNLLAESVEKVKSFKWWWWFLAGAGLYIVFRGNKRSGKRMDGPPSGERKKVTRKPARKSS